MTEPYTPTIDEMREHYADQAGFLSRRQMFRDDFDRGLAAHDREVRERVAQEIEAELYAHGEEHAEGTCPECDLVFAAAEIAREGQA